MIAARHRRLLRNSGVAVDTLLRVVRLSGVNADCQRMQTLILKIEIMLNELEQRRFVDYKIIHLNLYEILEWWENQLGNVLSTL